jgi:hypothetical protein
MEYLQRGLKAVPTQFYFINLYAPGSKLSQRAAENPIAQFKKWGFLARETPTVNAYQKKTVGHLDRSSRFNVLQGIFKKKKEISLNEYRTATGHSISRQQALQDLKTLAKLKRGTKGRGARWVLK